MNILIFTDVNGVIGFGRYAGAYRIATELRLHGYSTQVIEFLADMTLIDFQNICDKYIDNDSLFVGFSTTLLIKKTKSNSESRLDRSKENKHSGHLPHDNDYCQQIFSIFKNKNPRLKIVLGGARTNKTNLPGVDYWFWGLADTSIIAFADFLKKNIPIKTHPVQYGEAISHTDYPVHNYRTSKIIWEDNDYIFENEHLPIEIDRGCIYRCAFCANPLHKRPGEYAKDPYVVYEELLYNYEKFGTTGYMFCDDTFNDSNEKVKVYHQLFQKLPFKLEWTGYGRVDCIATHEEQIELLLESGVRAILFGIETFSPYTTKYVGKGLQPEKMKDTLYRIKEKWGNEVIITGSFIIGLPEESEDSIWSTVEWLKRKDCPLDDVIFSPLNIRTLSDNPNAPLSRIAKNPLKYGYKMSPIQTGTGISSDGPQWENQFMNKKHAETLARDIQQLFTLEKPIADWAIYSRMRSIGYSHEELTSNELKKTFSLVEANRRREILRNNYMNKLIK